MVITPLSGASNSLCPSRLQHHINTNHYNLDDYPSRTLWLFQDHRVEHGHSLELGMGGKLYEG